LGLRVESDVRGEKITRKIAENAARKIPFILVVGDREKEAGTIAVRQRGDTQGKVMPMAEAIALIQSAIAQKL
jgi:threonyl-tRNA synthetase